MKARIHAFVLAVAATTAFSTALASATHASAAPLGGNATDETPWIEEFDAAAAKAKAEGKNLLVDFTGSDWCTWCIRLHDEVFSKEEFLDYATARYVLVSLDFPRTDQAKADVPNPKRNEELRQEFDIEGFPTVLLMTPDMEIFGRTGYLPGGPKSYVEHLSELQSSWNEAVELVTAFEAAQGPERMAALTKILDLLEGLAPESPIVGRVEGPAREALTLDPANAAGLKLRAVKGLLETGHDGEGLRAAAREVDPKNEAGVFELAILAQYQAAEAVEDLEPCVDALDELLAVGDLQAEDKAVVLLANAAIWSQQYFEDLDRAKKYARMAIDLEPDDEDLVRHLNSILES